MKLAFKIFGGIIAFGIFSILLFFGSIFFNAPIFNWGHSFGIENETSKRIDSVYISFSGIENMLVASEDGSIVENLVVPRDGYPCATIVRAYSKGEIIEFKSDSFNCYNCDGHHTYTLINDSAVYSFHP